MSISTTAFNFVRELVRAESAIVLEPGKEYLVESRLLPLARKAGHPDVDAYVKELSTRRNASALKQVVEALTTNETSWFRDSDPFTALRQSIFPALAKTRSNRELRDLGGGLLERSGAVQHPDDRSGHPRARRLEDRHAGDRPLAGDARPGRRRASTPSSRSTAACPRPRWSATSSGPALNWRISPALAAQVQFRQLNLVRPVPADGEVRRGVPSQRAHLLRPATKRDILRRVRQVMAPDGHLFLGAAEMTMGVDDAWERVPAGRSSVYKIREEQPSCAR